MAQLHASRIAAGNTHTRARSKDAKCRWALAARAWRHGHAGLHGPGTACAGPRAGAPAGFSKSAGAGEAHGFALLQLNFDVLEKILVYQLIMSS